MHPFSVATIIIQHPDNLIAESIFKIIEKLRFFFLFKDVTLIFKYECLHIFKIYIVILYLRGLDTFFSEIKKLIF